MEDRKETARELTEAEREEIEARDLREQKAKRGLFGSPGIEGGLGEMGGAGATGGAEPDIAKSNAR